ncbi:hypothetical protein [Streptomyces griseolus]|uniref:hypothetical protein n=1 Tax=Streptomyces griseolus TaxID=1909 RepID=UPI00224486AF|nr:hypothetical protein [Streptomyces griseolus]MCW8217786.1 hypothetical protein [Streptomyces griseolus]
MTRIVNSALSLQLGTTRRSEIEAQAAQLTELLAVFAATPLPEGDRVVRELRQDAVCLLETAPEPGALVFSVHSHMRALARVLRRLVAVETAGDADAMEPSRVAAPAGQPSGTYRVPSGLTSARGQQRRTSLTGGGTQ